MKLSIEAFLFDNTLMNACVFALTAVWLGVRIRWGPTLLVSLCGAVYALLSLFVEPTLAQWYVKIPCFLALSLPLFRSAGSILRSLPFLLLSAATVGGLALMLTLLLGGRIASDGSLIGTVSLRAALVSMLAAAMLPRLMRTILRNRKKRPLYTSVTVRFKTHTYRLKALIDSGNLLKEPITGLPVVLIDRTPDRPTVPIPYANAAQSGLLYGERAGSLILTEFGGVSVDCFAARSPLPITDAQAILPESVLPNEWRTNDDRMDTAPLVAPSASSARWQTHYLLVHSHKRKPSGAARSGGGGALHRACADRQGSEG